MAAAPGGPDKADIGQRPGASPAGKDAPAKDEPPRAPPGAKPPPKDDAIRSAEVLNDPDNLGNQ